MRVDGSIATYATCSNLGLSTEFVIVILMSAYSVYLPSSTHRSLKIPHRRLRPEKHFPQPILKTLTESALSTTLTHYILHIIIVGLFLSYSVSFMPSYTPRSRHLPALARGRTTNRTPTAAHSPPRQTSPSSPSSTSHSSQGAETLPPPRNSAYWLEWRHQKWCGDGWDEDGEDM